VRWMKSSLKEGLRTNDLKDLVYPEFHIDTFKSKMGEDKDVCVIAFQARERLPAKDLMEFIEKGYDFVLDADVSSGENQKGEYTIFVELERTFDIAENIKEMLYGLRKLTGIKEWNFSYYKSPKKFLAIESNLKTQVPTDSDSYQKRLQEYRTEKTKKFFDKTVLDDLTIEESTLTIIKPFGQNIRMEIVREGDTDEILQSLDAPLVEDESSISEIFWLTKVLGDYNISKYGDSFMFSNKDQAMLLKRRN
jgi:hypothetical protein